MAFQKFEKLAVLPPLLENEIRYRAEICFILFTIKGPDSAQKINKSAAPERAQNGTKICITAYGKNEQLLTISFTGRKK